MIALQLLAASAFVLVLAGIAALFGLDGDPSPATVLWQLAVVGAVIGVLLFGVGELAKRTTPRRPWRALGGPDEPGSFRAWLADDDSFAGRFRRFYRS